jgi:cytochrome c-type biogenesis protein CcmH
MFWILVAILTAAVAIILTHPLMRSKQSAIVDGEGEVAVYRDQLSELERERASGLIGETEAEYARAEIGRRLLAVASGKSEHDTALTARRHSVIASLVTAALPITGLCLYLFMGSPNHPDMPLEARLENPGSDMNLLIAKAERHLAQNPADGAGWDVLAPIYFKTMRFGDAEMAYRNAIRLLGDSPERLTGLAETLVTASQGIVTQEAQSAFADAEKLRPGNPRARFYLALALEQAGKKDEARDAFAAILKASPAGAPWIPLVQAHLEATGGDAAVAAVPKPAAPGNPTAEDIEAANAMAPEDRQAMIAGMVESLDGKLRDQPDNFEGWMRLVRSYAMLNNDGKAKEALQNGLKAFPPDGEQGKKLLALAQQLGIPADGVTQ